MSFSSILITLLQGFGNTCVIFALTLVCALPLGLIIAFGSMSRLAPLRWLTRTFVWIIRGTPLMLQVIIVFYGPGLIWGPGTGFDRIPSVLIAFIINYAAYFSEIYRSGIQSVPRGQFEAAQVLGMKKRQIFFKVVLMQVVKHILPPMSNEIITLVKDTAIARVIAIREIIMEAYNLSAKGLISPLFYAGAFYLIFIGLLTILFGFIERKLDYFRV